MAVERSGPSVGELLSLLARDTGVLVRQEVRLASTELTAKAKTLARTAALIGIGGAVAQVGLTVVLLAIVVGLQAVLPLWIAGLVVGAVVLVAGYLLVQKGLVALRRLDPVPTQTVETVRNDVVWAKEQLR